MKRYVLIFLVCVIPRLLYFFIFPLREAASLDAYWYVADDFFRHGTLSLWGEKTTAIEPLYPLFLGLTRGLTGDNHFLIILIQIGISALGCLFLYKLSLLLSGDQRIAFLASLLYSFCPYLIAKTSAFWAVTLFTSLLIVSAYYYCKAVDLRNSFYCGVAFGLTLLTRAMVLPAFVLGLIVLMLRRRFLHAAIIFATAAILVSPYLVRNWQLDRSLLPTRNGWVLFQGNCEYSDQLIPKYSPTLLSTYGFELVRKERPELVDPQRGHEQIEGRNSAAFNTFYTKKALEFMKKNPWRTLKLKALNVLYLFHPRLVAFYPIGKVGDVKITAEGKIRVANFPSRSPLVEWIYTTYFSALLLAAPLGVYLRRKELHRDFIFFCIAFSFIVVYSLYWPATKYRAPMDFILMFYSAVALSQWAGLLRAQLGRQDQGVP